MPYNVGDKVVYWDPNRVYTVTAVAASGYTIQLDGTTPIPGVPDKLLSPNNCSVGTMVEYLDPNRVYTVKAVYPNDTYTLLSPDDQVVGPVPDGLIRPH